LAVPFFARRPGHNLIADGFGIGIGVLNRFAACFPLFGMDFAQPMPILRIPQTTATQSPVTHLAMFNSRTIGMKNTVFHFLSPGHQKFNF
jgi:hypothetical protein